MARGTLVSLVVACLACGDGSPGGDAGPSSGEDAGANPGGDAGPDSGPEPDPSDVLYDPTHVLEVQLELEPADWDALRRETRSAADLTSTDCLTGPFGSPFHYFAARATIDGTTLERIGVRKKGIFGSLDSVRPALKLKLDEYVAGQELAGVDRLTLNNSKQDPAFVRQCVTYDVFARAGIPAPRCNFAHVTVNGDDLGLYVNVEPVGKRLLRRHFADDGGNLYEGTVSDFRPDWVVTFEKKTNESDPSRADLDAAVEALTAPEDELLAALGPVFDLDQFLSFWAAEVLLAHWDGYAANTNNFFVYRDPTTARFAFIPWGTDQALGSGGPDTTSVAATGILARRLYDLPQTRDRYVAELGRLLDEVWDEDSLLAEVDRMQRLIAPIADPDGQGELTDRIEDLRELIRSRRAEIEAELEEGPPAWTAPLRGPPCFEHLGEISAEFETSWGTIDELNPFDTGTGTLEATIGGEALATTQTGSMAGFDPDVTAHPLVRVVAMVEDGTFAVLQLEFDPEAFEAGGDLPFDWATAFGALVRYDLASDTTTLLGLLADGSVQLDEAATEPGAPVSGRLQAQLRSSPL